MAYRATNDFVSAADPRIILAVTNLSTVISTNVPVLKGFTSGNSLTNGFSTNADGTVTPLVGLPFRAATNNRAMNTIIYIAGFTGITNASGVVTNYTLAFGANTIYYQSP